METPKNTFENKEGCDVGVTVYLMRHAHKDSYKGELSHEGETYTRELGQKFERLTGIYKTAPLEVAHSGHKRPRRTAELLIQPDSTEATQGDVRLSGEVREALKDMSSEALDKAYYELLKGNVEDESAGLQMVIDTGDTRFDAESPSSVEISQKVAGELLRIVDETKQYPSGTKKPITLISHSSVIENFLVDLLDIRKEKNSVRVLGGGLKFLEDFRLYVHRKSPEEVELHYRFREFEGALTEERLRQLAGKADEA